MSILYHDQIVAGPGGVSRTKLEEALSTKQDKLTGQPGQVVGFDGMGLACAVRGWSNQNLLNNWYWGNPVNRNGRAEYSVRDHTIDCWVMGWNPETLPDGAKIELFEGYIRWTGLDSWMIHRFIGLEHSGKLLTLRVLFADGTLLSGSATYNYEDDYENQPVFFDKEEVLTAKAQRDEVGKRWRVTLWNRSTDELKIVALKLEEGPQQTLAHQDADGNWVLNDPPPNKALELAKCQRYMLVLPDSNSYYDTVGVGCSFSTTEVKIGIPLPVTMRTFPAITLSGMWTMIGNGKSYTFDGSTRTLLGTNWAQNMITVVMGGFSGLTNYQTYMLHNADDSTAKLILDANL